MIGMIAERNMGTAKEMTMSVATTSVKHQTKSEIWKGIIISIKSMSDENLFIILPRGLVSKKCIGLLMIPDRRPVCMCLAAMAHLV